MKMAGSRLSSQSAFITFIFMFFGTVVSAAHVPLLIWSSESLAPLASPAAGHITSNEQLSAYLTSAVGSRTHTVLLFLQEKLSQDDFTVYGGVFGNKQNSAFKNLEAALQSPYASVTFPAVEGFGSSAVPALLQETLGVSPVLVDEDTLPELKLSSSVNNLLLIKLPYCSSDKPCRELLKHNDEIIGHVLKNLEARSVPYTAMFTGQQPSRVISEPAPSKESGGRSLLQAVRADVHSPIIFNVSGNPCIMLWAQSLLVSFSPTTGWTDLALQTPTLTGSTCNTTNSRLVLSYSGGITLSFSMSRRFYPVSARNWFTLDFVELLSNGTTGSYIGSRNIYAPAEYSYHCQSVSSFQDALLVPIKTNTSASNWRLNFVDFQIQGFGLNNGTNFSYANDCAGFFTPGIWMGLLTSLLMLFIFVYGLHMIMHLNTMDRFDDPKGPSISVPQSE